jgi:hypothetical protein
MFCAKQIIRIDQSVRGLTQSKNMFFSPAIPRLALGTGTGMHNTIVPVVYTKFSCSVCNLGLYTPVLREQSGKSLPGAGALVYHS